MTSNEHFIDKHFKNRSLIVKQYLLPTTIESTSPPIRWKSLRLEKRKCFEILFETLKVNAKMNALYDKTKRAPNLRLIHERNNSVGPRPDNVKHSIELETLNQICSI